MDIAEADTSRTWLDGMLSILGHLKSQVKNRAMSSSKSAKRCRHKGLCHAQTACNLCHGSPITCLARFLSTCNRSLILRGSKQSTEPYFMCSGRPTPAKKGSNARNVWWSTNCTL